jgi:hypothetical protein
MQDPQQLSRLAAMFATPDPGQPPPDPAGLGSPGNWDGLALAVHALQQGTPAEAVLAMLSAEQRDILFAIDPAARPTEIPAATWHDMANALGPLAWAWHRWLPEAMLTLLAGQSESGKSALALRVAGCYTNGLPWPDGTPFTGETGLVLWCEAESGQAINLDRAQRWGLSLEKIICPFRDPLVDVILEDEAHRANITALALRPDIRLVVVDSLSGANERRDENSQEMLRVVKWLAELAKVSGKPVLLCHHLRKRGMQDAGEGVTLDRVRGSSAIVQTARVVWAMDRPDPTAPADIRLSVIKSNLGPKPDPVGVAIGDTGIRFDGAAPEPPRVETQEERARDWLLQMLKKGPMRTTEIEDHMDGLGISFVTAKRVKGKLGIVSIRQRDADGRDYWMWSLPARATE